MGARGSLALGQNLEVWATERYRTRSVSFLSRKETSAYKMINIILVHEEGGWAPGNMVQEQRAWCHMKGKKELGVLRALSQSPLHPHPSGYRGSKGKREAPSYSEQKGAYSQAWLKAS